MLIALELKLIKEESESSFNLTTTLYVMLCVAFDLIVIYFTEVLLLLLLMYPDHCVQKTIFRYL